MPITVVQNGEVITPEIFNKLLRPIYSVSPDEDGQIPYPTLTQLLSPSKIATQDVLYMMDADGNPWQVSLSALRTFLMSEGVVGTNQISGKAVTTDKLDDAAVTAVKAKTKNEFTIEDGALASAQYSDGILCSGVVDDVTTLFASGRSGIFCVHASTTGLPDTGILHPLFAASAFQYASGFILVGSAIMHVWAGTIGVDIPKFAAVFVATEYGSTNTSTTPVFHVWGYRNNAGQEEQNWVLLHPSFCFAPQSGTGSGIYQQEVESNSSIRTTYIPEGTRVALLSDSFTNGLSQWYIKADSMKPGEKIQVALTCYPPTNGITTVFLGTDKSFSGENRSLITPRYPNGVDAPTAAVVTQCSAYPGQRQTIRFTVEHIRNGVYVAY